jgi:uroporphyrin-III C-methyltransferase
MTSVRATGKVYLIGAGPGDPDLLTLKAVKALQQCDVLLVDDLVNVEILQYARADARIIPVGKRGGCKSTPQAFIERMMVRFARAGAIVGRLKGGDPFVFGRGGEEMLRLRAAAIAFEIIPGLTSGCAVPAALQIPVTHREFSRGVTFVTGHSRNGEPLNYAALAASDTTLVIYMGVTHLAAICAGLRAAGMAATMPACAIQNGTREPQQQVIATLATLTAAVNAAQLSSPAIIVIGRVVTLAAGADQGANHGATFSDAILNSRAAA